MSVIALPAGNRKYTCAEDKSETWNLQGVQHLLLREVVHQILHTGGRSGWLHSIGA